LHDYSDGKLKQHSPKCEHHRDFLELRDQLKSQELCSKRNDHYRGQKGRDEKVVPSDDKEFEQI
jgi:hypothetical protein